MKKLLIILYTLATLFTCHQTTYWWWGAGSCPPEFPEAKAQSLLFFEIYGISFLILIGLLVVVGVWYLCKCIRRWLS